MMFFFIEARGFNPGTDPNRPEPHRALKDSEDEFEDDYD